MKKNELLKIFEYPIHSSEKGSLLCFHNASLNKLDSLPFDAKRIFVIRDAKENDIRGGHTHHKTRQILFVLNGSCTITLDNGLGLKENIKLDKFNKGIILEPYVWHTMEDFSKDTIILVIADTEYDEKDYIRKYEDFLNFIKK